MKDFIQAQQDICNKYNSDYTLINQESIIGVSLNTINRKPINGLRHPPVADTCGWYIWGGEELSSDADFFKPLHLYHLVEYYPHIIKYLGLSPGWRFLAIDNYEDVWFDEKLLII